MAVLLFRIGLDEQLDEMGKSRFVQYMEYTELADKMVKAL